MKAIDRVSLDPDTLVNKDYRTLATRPVRLSGLFTALLLLGACASNAPRDVTDVCDIFDERRSWYRAAKSAEARWQVPIEVNMAFIYQESSFRSRARPERNRLLWILPGPRPSTAYGYAQALDSTWADYEERSGNHNASRSDFADAIDFVAWYNANSHRLSGIANHDARNLYFAYHEGNGGFQRGSFRRKEWLLQAADRVQSNATRFGNQLAACRADLDKNWFQRLLS